MNDAVTRQLNPQQREAVLHNEGPLLVLAGAGSGKTRVITFRVARLLAEGFPAHSILAVTFTNKAAREMRERVDLLSGERAKHCWIGTFHSICARILRTDGAAIGVPRNFVILDDRDQQTLLKRTLEQCGIDPTLLKPRQAGAEISRAKEQLIGPSRFQAEAREAEEQQIARVYRAYQQSLDEMGALDFDDLLVKSVELLARDAGSLERYRSRFQQILVDEYQDINRPQYELIRMLALPRQNLCVVGDDDQSVYGWRGACVEFILSFEHDFPQARVIKMEQNYRSTQMILDAAHQVVQRLPGRHPKRLWTENKGGAGITVISAPDDEAESRVVADLLTAEVAAGRARYADFAILYRTNVQSRLLEDSLRLRRIPYRIAAGHRFYDRKEVRDLLAYLRLALNPLDDISCRRVINEPARAVGQRTVELLQQFASHQRISLLQAAARAAEVEGLRPRAISALQEFAAVLNRAAAAAEEGAGAAPVLELLIAQSGYRKAIRDEGGAEAGDGEALLDEFIRVARQYDSTEGGGLAGFLEEMALISDIDTLGPNDDSVILMTLHAAKGLEFPQVIICGMEEGIFPHSRALRGSDPESMNEERRLCYVGFTRARERLFLTHACRRQIFGSVQPQAASRFLSELPAELMHYVNARNESLIGARPRRYAGTPASSSRPRPPEPRPAQPGSLFQPGDRVQHSHFGAGIVVKSIKAGDDEEVSVAFFGHGVKKLMAGVARLDRLE